MPPPHWLLRGSCMALLSPTSALAMRPDRVGLEVGPRFWLNGGKGPTRTGGMEGKPAGTPKYLVCWVYLDLDLDHVPPHHVFSPRGSRLTIQCLTAELDNNAAVIFLCKIHLSFFSGHEDATSGCWLIAFACGFSRSTCKPRHESIQIK